MDDPPPYFFTFNFLQIMRTENKKNIKIVYRKEFFFFRSSNNPFEYWARAAVDLHANQTSLACDVKWRVKKKSNLPLSQIQTYRHVCGWLKTLYAYVLCVYLDSESSLLLRTIINESSTDKRIK